MPAKQFIPNQHTPLHFIYGRSDCCLCEAQHKLWDTKQELFALLQAYRHEIISARELVDKLSDLERKL